MTDLIDLDAAIAALSERQSNYREETSTWAQIALDILILRALPTIDPTTLTSNSVDDSKTANPVVNDPAAIREAALREAAASIQWHITNLKHQNRGLALDLAVYGRDVVLAMIGNPK